MSASTIRHVLSLSGSIAFTVEAYGAYPPRAQHRRSLDAMTSQNWEIFPMLRARPTAQTTSCQSPEISDNPR